MRWKYIGWIASVSVILLFFCVRAWHLNTANSEIIAHRFNDYQEILGDFGSVYYSCCHMIKGPSYFPKAVVKNSAGEVLYSWRFTNFLNGPVPYQNLRGSNWKASIVSRVRNTTPILYSPVDSGNGSFNTSVFAVAMSGSAFDESTVMDVQHIPGDLVLFADVYDSNTHWMQPGDFDSSTVPEELRVARGLGNESYSGFFLAFADGEIWYMTDKTPIAEVKKFFTVTGAKENHRESVLRNYLQVKQNSDLYRSFVPISRKQVITN